MKTTKILLAATAAAAFTLANSVNASDLYLSPRAAEQRSHVISGINTDPNLTANRDWSVAPRTVDLRTKVAAPNSHNDPDLVAQIRKVSGSPKSLDLPGFASFQVAPVK